MGGPANVFERLRHLTLEVDLSQGHGLFDQLPLPQDLNAAVREWLRLACFTVEGSPYYFVHNIGVKPGDPSADVCFCICVLLLSHALERRTESGGSSRSNRSKWDHDLTGGFRREAY